MDAPEGLIYVPGFLPEAEQAALFARLGAIPARDWGTVHFRGVTANRRKIAYGWNYEPDGRALSPATPLPDDLSSLRDRCGAAVGMDPGSLVQASLTWYPPGAGIGRHRDAPYFGEVVGVSLGTPARMIFRREKEKFILRLEPGSLLALRGPARQAWTHEMPPVTAPRYSIYFRTLRRKAQTA